MFDPFHSTVVQLLLTHRPASPYACNSVDAFSDSPSSFFPIYHSLSLRPTPLPSKSEFIQYYTFARFYDLSFFTFTLAICRYATNCSPGDARLRPIPVPLNFHMVFLRANWGQNWGQNWNKMCTNGTIWFGFCCQGSWIVYTIHKACLLWLFFIFYSLLLNCFILIFY